MSRKEKPEVVQGDKALLQDLLIVSAFYILFLIWLEPLIDFFLSFDPLLDDPLSISALNRKKILISAVAFAIMRSVPMMVFFWIGYRAVLSASLPPARMRFPFTVVRIKGKQAKMFGILFMAIAVVLIYFEMLNISHTVIDQ